MYLLPIWLMPTPHSMTVWPSGLTRWLKAPFREEARTPQLSMLLYQSTHTQYNGSGSAF